MKADELTDLACDWLAFRFPGAKVVTEMPVGHGGRASIDVAAICADQIVGVEIKGEGDSPSRLKLQGPVYDRICRQVYLLACPGFETRIQSHRPNDWKPIFVKGDPVKFPPDSPLHEPRSLSQNKADYCGPLHRGVGLGLCPAALAGLIWTNEYGLLHDALLDVRDSHPWDDFKKIPIAWSGRLKDDKIASIAANIPLCFLEPAVCTVLRARPDWKLSKKELAIRMARNEERIAKMKAEGLL